MVVKRPFEIKKARTLVRKTIVQKPILYKEPIALKLRIIPGIRLTPDYLKLIKSRPLEFKFGRIKKYIGYNGKKELEQVGKQIQIYVDNLMSRVIFSNTNIKGLWLSDFVKFEPINELIVELNSFDKVLGDQVVKYIRIRMTEVFGRKF